MSERDDRRIREIVDEIYRCERSRILSILIRLLGDFDLAEDAMQEAFSAALRQWKPDSIPTNPRAWLVSAGRFKAVDMIRRESRLSSTLRDLVPIADESHSKDEGAIEDDRLRLIFTCCHPALSREARVALTLREVGGLTTEEIARGLLLSPSTVAQRIVRAKARIREAKIPFEVPQAADLPERLENVLQVTYLIFNEGYYASSGYSLTRESLSAEALRLGRLLARLLPRGEVFGLLALMLLHESRRAARTSASGDLILLDDQDRSRWNREWIGESERLVQKALSAETPGAFSLQATIALVHAQSPSGVATDWSRIVELYDRLVVARPNSVTELNRAVAVAMRDGPAAGLPLVDELLESGGLEEYGLAHATRADLCRRLGLFEEARASYLRALELTTQEPERRFLRGRLNEISSLAC